MAAPRALLVGGAGGTGTLIAAGLAARGYDLTILHRGVHEPAEIAAFRHIHADPHFAEPVEAALGRETFDLVILTYGRVEQLARVFATRCARLIAVGGIPIYGGFLEPASRHPPGMPLLADEDGPLADLARMQLAGARSFAAKMIAAENAVLEQHRAGRYVATILRYPSVYGPNAIAGGEESIIRRVGDGRDFILLPFEGLGTITRCSTWNAAHALIASIDCAGAAGRVFNCADEDQFTLGQWTRLILDALGSTAQIVGLPGHLSWAAAHLVPLSGTTSPHAFVDAGASRTVLGARDVRSAREALAATIAWRLANRSTAAARTWEDPADYRLEDELRGRLDAFAAQCAPLKRMAAPVHPYPHPKQPGLAIDHRGR